MDFLHRPRRLLITGRSGSGKTEYFRRYVEAVHHEYGNIYVYDHETEFSQRTGSRLVRSVEDLQEAKGLQCYDYSDMYPGDVATGLEFYADYCFQRSQSAQTKTLFCVDEMQKLLSTDVLSTELATIIETGRRYKVDTCFITQQVNLLHNRVRNQVTEVITFRQNDARALQWLCDFGFDPSRVRDLDSGDYICLRDDGELREGNIFSGACARPQIKKTVDKPPVNNQIPVEAGSQPQAPVSGGD